MTRQVRLLSGISIFWLSLSMLSDGLTTLVLPDQLAHITGGRHKATWLGLISFIGLGVSMLTQPLAGAISDRLRPRWDRRHGLTVGVALILLALAVFAGAQTLLLLFVAFLLVQVAASVAQAAQQAFIPELVPAPRRGLAAGLKGLMDLAGAMLGFIVLGHLLAGGNPRPALLVIAAVLIGTLLLTLGLVREPAVRPVSVSARVSLRGAFRIDVSRHRAFLWLIGARFLFLLGTYAVGRFFLYFVADRLALDADQAAEHAGTLLGTLALLTAVTAVPAGWVADRYGRVPVMRAGALTSAAGVLLLIPAGRSQSILLAGSLMAIGSAGFAAANWALTADLVPHEEAARFMGIANIGTVGAAAAAGLLGPLVDIGEGIGDGAGYAALFSVAAIACAGSVIALRGVQSDNSDGPVLTAEGTGPLAATGPQIAPRK